MSALSDNLYNLRKEKGLTQEEVAKCMDVVFRSYRRYESGEREPVASTLVKMADYYGVTIDYLLGRTDERTQGQSAPTM